MDGIDYLAMFLGTMLLIWTAYLTMWSIKVWRK